MFTKKWHFKTSILLTFGFISTDVISVAQNDAYKQRFFKFIVF